MTFAKRKRAQELRRREQARVPVLVPRRLPVLRRRKNGNSGIEVRPAQTAALVTRQQDSNQRPLHHISTDAEARELAPKVPNVLARSTAKNYWQTRRTGYDVE